MNPFAELINQIGVEFDRRQYGRNAARLGRRIREGGKRNRQTMAGLAGELEVMTKAMTANLVQTRAAQRQDAIDTLARINAKATEMASTGQLTGHEGALLDGAIARVADRIREL